MNVEIGTETPIFLFWEYLFRNFGVLSLCIIKGRLTWIVIYLSLCLHQLDNQSQGKIAPCSRHFSSLFVFFLGGGERGLHPLATFFPSPNFLLRFIVIYTAISSASVLGLEWYKPFLLSSILGWHSTVIFHYFFLHVFTSRYSRNGNSINICLWILLALKEKKA